MLLSLYLLILSAEDAHQGGMLLPHELATK